MFKLLIPALERARLGVLGLRALGLSIVVLGATMTGANATSVHQFQSLSHTYAYQGAFMVAGEIALANGTNSVSAMTATASIADQGWGGYDPWGNMVRVGLWEGASLIWSDRIGGGERLAANYLQNYDVLASATQFANLNAALAGILWTGSSDVRIKVYTAGTASPGWSLTIHSGSFEVTSSALAPVPLPAAGALLLVGLGLMVGIGRRRST